MLTVKLAMLLFVAACLTGCKVTYQATYHTDEMSVSIRGEDIAMQSRRDR